MRKAAGKLALDIGILLAVVFAAACRGDVTATDDADALARDSTLELNVLLANQDTGISAGVSSGSSTDSRVRNNMNSGAVMDRGVSAQIGARDSIGPGGELLSDAEIEMQARLNPPVAQPRPSPSIAQSRPAPTAPIPAAAETVGRAPSIARSPAAPKPARTPSSEEAVTPTPARAVASIATVPAGAELLLEAGQRICVNTSSVGDRFTARLTRNLPGPDGTLVPSGARASVVVTSLVGPMGEEEIEIDVRSVSVGGRSYSVDARVTDIELDRRPGAYRCIPDDGRITAQLTRPLRIRQ